MKSTFYFLISLVLALSGPLYAGDGSRGENHSADNKKSADIDRGDRDEERDDDRSGRHKDRGDYPSIQASGLAFSDAGPAAMTVSWTNGNGTGRAVFVKRAAGSRAKPENNELYRANPQFKKGEEIGSTGWHCVYNGTGSQVTVTGLKEKGRYRVHVCEYNAVGKKIAYNDDKSSLNPANRDTAEAENQPPVLAAIGAQSVNEAQTLTFSASATDPDGTTPTLAAANLPAGATFANNTFSWTPTLSQAGSFSVLFTASDGTLADSETVAITVVNVNQPPVLAAIGAKSVNEMQELTFAVSATDADGTTPILTAEQLPAGAAFVDKSFSWTPLYDQAGSHIVVFKASDGVAETSEMVTITVADVNRPPVLAAIEDKMVNEGEPLSFIVTASDPDGTIPALSAADMPAGASLSDKGDGTAEFSWTPSFDQAGTYTVTLTANDVITPVSGSVSITVNNVNRKPVISVASFYSVVAGQELQFTVTANDPDGSPVTLSTTGVPAGATFADKGNNAGSFMWTPGAADAGEYTVKFVTDDSVLKDSVMVNVVVLERALSENLSGYWRFDEVAGTEVRDGSGLWHSGELVGGVLRSADVAPKIGSGTSLALAGGSQYARVNGMGLIDTYTVSLWLKCGPSQTAMNPRIIDYGDRRAFLYLENGSMLKYYVKNDAGVLYGGLTCVFDGGDTAWHHAAAVLKGDTLRLYVDGIQRGEGKKTGVLSAMDDVLYIGAENEKYYLNGGVDEVRLYNRALNPVEIRALANGGGRDIDASPLVEAGNNISLMETMLPVAVALNGRAEDEYLNVSDLAIVWRMISGPAAVMLVDSTALSTSMTVCAEGMYVLQLSVSDGVNTSHDSITVLIGEAQVNIADRIVGYWQFDEMSGTEAVDKSGLWHNGTLIGGAMRSADVASNIGSGTSLALFGGSEYVRVDGMGLIDTYTVSLWLKCGPSQSTMNPRVLDYGDRRAFLYFENGSILKYYVKNNNGRLYGGLSYDLGSDTAWHHVVAVLKGDTLRLYVDGVKRGEGKKIGELSTVDDVLYIGAENGIYCLNGGVDDVLMYSRALNIAEITTLANGQSGDVGTQLLSYMQLNNQQTLIEPVQQIVCTDDFTNLNNFTDLSLLIPWGTTGSTGLSAFTTDTSQGRPSVFLTPEALLNRAIDTITGLRSFGALDYRFSNAVTLDSNVISIAFSAKVDTGINLANSGLFNVILLDNYPEDKISGLDYNNFNSDPYGTPAYSIKIQPQSQKSFMLYGGANGGKFDNYQYQWWLPGSVSPTDGSVSLVVGAGEEYPQSSWKSSERAMGDTAWVNYKWLVRYDGMELYKNDTLYGIMELPAYSYTAPGYTRYDQFKALRLAWQGQCYVSELEVTAFSTASAPNRPPQIAFISPLHDTTVLVGSGFSLQAEAADADGLIDRVEFYANNQLLGTCTQPPYAFSWQSVPEGTSEVTVVAVDDLGAVSVGKVLKVTAVQLSAAQ